MLNTNFCLINFLNITIVLNFQQNTVFPVSVSEGCRCDFVISVRMQLTCLVGRRHTWVNNRLLWALVSPLIDAAPKTYIEKDKESWMRRWTASEWCCSSFHMIIIKIMMMRWWCEHVTMCIMCIICTLFVSWALHFMILCAKALFILKFKFKFSLETAHSSQFSGKAVKFLPAVQVDLH